MHQPHLPLHHDRKQIDQPFDIRPPRESRIELARPQRAIAGTVEHRAKLILVEKCLQPQMVLGVAGNDALARERPIVFLPNRDDLPRIARTEIIERIVACHPGDAGDQKRQGNRFVESRNHASILTQRRRERHH